MTETQTACRHRTCFTKIRLLLLIGILCILFPSFGAGRRYLAYGAQASGTSGSQAGDMNWKRKNNFFYYYKNGRKLTGLQKIDGKTYYFDKKGRQRTGWREIDDKCYYFQIQNGSKGFLVTGRKVNGVRLDKSGVAKPTGATRTKLSLLIRYQELSDKLVRPGASMRTKLMKAFLYARRQSYGVITDPGYSGRWDEILASYFIGKGPADCTVKAAGFAYLANALGAKKVILRKYGHAHVEIGRIIYDPALANSSPDKGPLEYFERTFNELPRHSAWARRNGPHKVI